MKKGTRLRLVSLIILCALLFAALPQAAFAANSSPKLVALTFDDGPSKYTPRLLDGLKERGAKATFFMLGNCANTYPSTVKRAYEEGHQIASHTYDHPRLTSLSDSQVSSQVSRTKSALDSAIGAPNRYVVRPPYGDYNSRVLGQLGTAAIYWSVDSNDWRWTNNASKTVSEIEKNVFDGAIILLHDSHSWSVDAALTVVDDLQAKGYEFVTVSELFRRRGGSLSSGQIYYSKQSSGDDLPAINAPDVLLSVSGNTCYAVMSGDAGTDIYYTVDGSVPNSNSAKYSAPIAFDGSVYITAVSGYDMNGSRSPITRVTLNAPKKAVKPEISVDENGLITLSADGAVYYTTDGASPNVGSTLYTEPFTAEGGSVIAAFASASEDNMLPSETAYWCYSDEGFIYSDVAPYNWFYPYIEYAASNGLLNGQGGYSMAPDAALTRGMLVTMLYRMAGLPKTDAESGFSDVSAVSWYSDAVSWARENRVVGGYPDGTFRPDELISREQLAVVLYNYHRNVLGLLTEGDYILSSFTDGDDVAAYADIPMKWAVDNFLISGVSSDVLAPKASATRAQTAAILMRFSELTKDEEQYYISDAELMELAALALNAMSSHNFGALAGVVSDSDELKLNFVPADSVVSLTKGSLGSAGSGEKLVFGKSENGEPDKITLSEYFDEYIWRADFIESDALSINGFTDGHEIDYIPYHLPRALFVDLRATAESGDKVFLTLVFERFDDEWYLSAVFADGTIKTPMETDAAYSDEDGPKDASHDTSNNEAADADFYGDLSSSDADSDGDPSSADETDTQNDEA